MHVERRLLGGCFRGAAGTLVHAARVHLTRNPPSLLSLSCATARHAGLTGASRCRRPHPPPAPLSSWRRRSARRWPASSGGWGVQAIEPDVCGCGVASGCQCLAAAGVAMPSACSPPSPITPLLPVSTPAHLPTPLAACSEAELQQLVAATDGATGSDLAAACRQAALAPVRTLLASGALALTPGAPPPALRPVCFADFAAAVRKTRGGG